MIMFSRWKNSWKGKVVAMFEKRTYLPIDQYQHISLDIETLGTKPGCKVLSIGACTLDLERWFHVLVSPNSQSGEADGLTVRWWTQQPGGGKFLQRCLTTGRSIPVALEGLTNWLQEVQEPNTPQRIWTQGNFDLPILEWQFKTSALPVPWKYYQGMDLRTARAMLEGWMSTPVRDLVKFPSHDALADAQYQAMVITEVLAKLKAAKDQK